MLHQKGETALKPKEWFDLKRVQYLQRWIASPV
jgi:hypothetical protein